MDSWLGNHKSELIRSWSPPTYVTSDGNNGGILVYERYVDLGQKPGRAYVDYAGNVRYTSPRQRGYMRTRMFYVDENGKINYWRTQGM